MRDIQENSEQPSTSEPDASSTSNPSRMSILPGRFDGATDFRLWLRHFNSCSDANGWNNKDRLRKMPAFLRGNLRLIFIP
jgi:hypothetical protein